MTHFVDKEEVRIYDIKGHRLEIIVNEKVFPPSEQGLFFAENITIVPGEKVLDIGTGTGIFAIVAAKLGGFVFATDRDKDAVEIAKKNAYNNNVYADFKVGKYFTNYKKFDVIIANIPSEVIAPEYRRKIGHKLADTIDGGFDGLDHWRKIVEMTPVHLKKNGRLYMTITGMADYRRAFKIIQENDFIARKIVTTIMPVKDFFCDYRDFYINEPYKSMLSIRMIDGKIVTRQDILELRLK
jgi:methylase of polypeptide subunit release factors